MYGSLVFQVTTKPGCAHVLRISDRRDRRPSWHCFGRYDNVIIDDAGGWAEAIAPQVNLRHLGRGWLPLPMMTSDRQGGRQTRTQDSGAWLAVPEINREEEASLCISCRPVKVRCR